MKQTASFVASESSLHLGLDQALDLINLGQVENGMNELVSCLDGARCASGADEWKTIVADVRRHPVVGLLHGCAIPHRSFAKPRGYPGDAVLIDYLYGAGEAAAHRNTGAVLGQVNDYLFAFPTAKAVRYRRARLAELIDCAQAQHEAPTIVSLAAGHLREIELTAAYRFGGKKAAITAVDHDPKSLTVIQRDYEHLGVETLAANVKAIVTGEIALKRSDLIYAAGLFDYLGPAFARALANRMFDSLYPGGRLLLANFAPDIGGPGFMEAVMDWWLTYRGEEAMTCLLESAPSERIADLHVYRDPDSQIVFLEATKQ